MQLLSTLNGTGWIHRSQDRKTRAQYIIDVWRTADGAIFGHGRIKGEIEPMIGPRHPASLVLADGNAVAVRVIGRWAGAESAEIYVPGGVGSTDQVTAAWPT